ncbi:tRNA nucleotidyltransferase cca2-like [Lycium ferocissimum]|uniref:tRNA nucleotidyltransferase cca2-like n=1 Tax=Lycium ferocissimum TaxID=112874 RepID=UPI0028168C8F|nr:tRNA nucleotidyltransferase cca2-like [Lycium ferocissimum]
MAESASPPSSSSILIDLTRDEKEIFDLLLKVVKHFNLDTHLRVAGGWVRDKLLGLQSNDIDIAIDNMTGQQFCEKVEQYKKKNEELCYDPNKVTVIKSKPDQSKHLETTKMRMHLKSGRYVLIDFVNLRSEDYSNNNSRIPTRLQQLGTALEDAYRRDLTINSLFYNIQTNSIEDFTKRGLEDLKSKRIVTPLNPKQTFMDDPLRVLRAIHFGARFGFMLDEELKKAAKDKDVRTALVDKISRERVGHEIDLMISGKQAKNPIQAMTSIADLKLFWNVFSVPCDAKPSNSEGFVRQCVAYLHSALRLLDLIGSSSFSNDQKILCLYAALFLPLRVRIYIYKEKNNKAKEREIPVVNHIVRDSLKLKASDAQTIISLHNAANRFVTFIPSLEVVEVGLLLREIKEFWRVALLLSMLLMHSVENIDKRSGLFKTVEDAIITTLGLEKVWEVKPLVDGKEIMEVLKIKSGGSVVKEWQQCLLVWQLEHHPSGTAKECLKWMKQKLGENEEQPSSFSLAREGQV